MFSLRSVFQNLTSHNPLRLSPVVSSQLHTSSSQPSAKVGSIWRLPRLEGSTRSTWPNQKENYIHRK